MLTTEYTWDCFYNQHHEQKEWYLSIDDTIHHIQSLLQTYLPTTSSLSVLHSGCGTSDLCVNLSTQLVENTRVTNTDFSQPVVDIMAAKHPELFFVREDARAMTFATDSFHLIVDKGTLDAASSNSKESDDNVHRILHEYHRVLIETKGVVLIFSLYGADRWGPTLEQHRALWHYDILSIAPSTTYDMTPEHVMRTEEVGGKANETFVIALMPQKQHAVVDTFPREDEESVEEPPGKSNGAAATVVMCLKCKTEEAIFECLPCGCLLYCKRCAMKLNSGKCKRCRQGYSGFRRRG
jgi:SAM-dependent methyltransferase